MRRIGPLRQAQIFGDRELGRPAFPITVGGWQTGGVEPVAGVSAVGRGGRVGQRGSYGIDGGYAGLAVFAVIEAGLAGTVAWAVRHRWPAIAALAAVGGAAVSGVGGELPVLHRAGQAGDLGAAAG